MSPRSKKEYLETIFLRFKRATRKEKTSILNEFCQVCQYHRKHAIRLLNNFKRFTKPKPKRRGPASRYNKPSIIEPLKRIWLTANLPCSKRLKVILPLWLPSYGQEFGGLSLETIKALRNVSPATIDRLLKPCKAKYKGRGRSTTKPGTLLRKHIPIKTNQWDESRPGFLEADSVAHCGTTTEGQYANTRSRAYHKNDNAHVEQKNWTHVRQWLGYQRFDDLRFVPLLNDLYVNEWRLFHNFFCPSVKLIEKKRIASKVIKRYDAPKTPYQRVLGSKHISTSVKCKIKEQFDQLNPFHLRKAMEIFKIGEDDTVSNVSTWKHLKNRL